MNKTTSLLVFSVGIALILYGLYTELSAISFGGRLGSIFLIAGGICAFWGSIGLIGKFFPNLNNSDSVIAKGFGGIIFGFGLLATLIAIGAIIFQIAQYSVETQAIRRNYAMPCLFRPNAPQQVGDILDSFRTPREEVFGVFNPLYPAADYSR